MTATTDVLIPALREVRGAEAAVADRFRTHLAVTPAGVHRQTLERHLDDAQDHVHRIDERLNALQPHGLLRDALGGFRHLTGQAARMARLPLDVAIAVPAAALGAWTEPAERHLLKNVGDQYAVTAAAVAACRAGERIAQGADDPDSRELLGTIRRSDEELLDALGGSLEQYAEAVVAAATARPWPSYDSMSAAEIRTRLKGAEPGLAQQTLDYERCHQARSTVLAAAERAAGKSPTGGEESP